MIGAGEGEGGGVIVAEEGRGTETAAGEERRHPDRFESVLVPVLSLNELGAVSGEN
jgi:hypothetical protein